MKRNVRSRTLLRPIQTHISSLAQAALCAALLLTPTCFLHAQSTTADVTGTITDASGAAIPNAKVTLTNLETKEVRTAETTSAGDYTFTLLGPGTYSIEIAQPGFKTYVFPQVSLAASDRAREDAKLEVGAQAETVQVSGQAPALQTDSSVLSSTVTERAVQDLPLNGRNYINLAQITPGANEGPPNGLTSGARPDDRRQTSSISVNGQSDVINDEMVDGLDNNERIIGTIGIRPSVESIKEINVQTNDYTAEVGRTAGGVINIITKSGTNTFHGSAYEFFRNDVLDAYPFAFGVPIPKPKLRQNQFGASVGGPIVRDKVFFYGDYEGLRQIQGQNPISTQVPLLSQYQALRTNPASLTDGGTVDPVGLAYALLYPAPNGPTLYSSSGAPISAAFVSSPTVTRNSDTADGRVDWQLSQGDLLFGRYTYNRVPSNFTGNLPTVSEAGLNIAPGGAIYNFYGNAKDTAQNAQINYIHTFNSNLILQLGFGYTRINNQSYPLNYGENVNQAFGQPNVNLDTLTSGLSPASVSGYADLGDGNYIPILDVDNTFQENGVVTITRGAHNIKIGAALIRRQALNFQNNLGIGSWSFNPITPPGSNTADPTGLAALVRGQFNNVQRSNSLDPPHYRTWEPSGFIQDDWHAASNLTLNLGVRYDIFTPFTEAHNAISNFDPATASIVIANTNGVNQYAGLNPTYSNVAPRVGFAFTARPNTVVRGGFGMSYVPENYTSNSSLKNQPFVSNYNCQLSSSGQLGPTCIANTFAAGLPLPTPESAANPSGSIADAVSPAFRSSYLEQFNLTLEQSFGGNVFQATYVGMLGRHLAAIYNDQNTPPPVSNEQLSAVAASLGNGANQSTAFQTLRPFYKQLPNVSNIGGYDSTGNSNYNSLQLSLTRRTRAGLTLGANYTLAHGLDDVLGLSNEINDGYGNVPSLLSAIEYGNSDVDIRNRGVVTGDYTLPFGQHLNGFEGALGKGWQLNTILVWESGEPFTVTNSQDIVTTNNEGHSDRPNMLRKANVSNPTINEYFDSTAFAPQLSGQIGTESRNPLYGPHYRHVDLSVFKTFPVWRESNIEFRAECFNITNTTNFANPNATLQVAPMNNAGGTPFPGQASNVYNTSGNNIGQISTTSPNYNPREFQFALKYQF